MRSPLAEGSIRGVVELSDKSVEASRIKAAQARRLLWLREQMGLRQMQAAELAGVTRFSWGRMEKGEALIDTVALVRFLARWGYSADWVVSGRATGLPEDLAYDLQTRARRSEADPPAAGSAAAGSAAARGAATSGTSRQRSRAGTGS